MKESSASGSRHCIALLLAAAAGFVATRAFAVPYVITTQGQRVEGTAIRATSEGEIILTLPNGQRSFFPGQYLKAVADKPAEIDQAAQLAQAKKYDEAIALLDKVVLHYRLLDWDNQASIVIGRVYAQKGDFAAAVGAYEKLFTTSPKSKEDPELQWAYRDALLQAKQYEKLETALNTVIGTGSRPEAARAQIMRGDIRTSQGQLESAVLDYLRTVVLFESEKEAQPEALFKAAETLKALRDPRAEGFYKKLIEQYPSSPYAQKAQSGKS
jgi:tetratricopeptide (TPR) repeat protein